MASKSGKAQKRGSTLVEALVAVAIVAVGIAGASKLMVATSHLSDQATERNTAITLARSRYEQMSVSAFGELDMWNESNRVVNALGLPDSAGNYNITTMVDYPQTNLVEIVIEVGIRNRVSLDFDRVPTRITTFISN